ncbi:MAG: hypothetical protein HY744_03515 [Deltaproteobacteria bacterium]|nr:hypothetical protein [Deltaproteobacteria bacterium]
MRRENSIGIVASLALLACAGTAPVPAEPATPASCASAPAAATDAPVSRAPSAAPAKPAPERLLRTCAAGPAELCLPAPAFAARLCDGDYPTVALALLHKSSPFTRGYLRGKVRAWNASGGGASEETLEFDEEVLVLRRRAESAGGIQVSGAGGGYDVLRWDGACVTLADGELTLQPAPRPKSARIVWQRLEVEMREALRRDGAINEAYLRLAKECKGASMGVVSRACVEADTALGRRIADYVRAGGAIAEPSKVP